MRRLIIAFGCLLAGLQPIQAAQTGIVSGWDNFYKDANYGQLGVWTGSGQGIPALTLIDPDVTESFTIRSGRLNLVFNHFDDTATSLDLSPTYVALLIVRVRKTDEEVSQPTLYMYRNDGWFRDWCRRCFRPDGDKKVLSRPGILKDVSDARAAEDEEALDKVLKPLAFDGQVDGASDINSWDGRDFWRQMPGLNSSCLSPGTVCEVDNVLLKFTPSAGRQNMHPVVYTGINVQKGDSVEIYSFSPTEIDFKNHYHLEIH